MMAQKQAIGRHVSQKRAAILLAATLQNVERFSKNFQQSVVNS